MRPPPERPKVYHITHVANLASIVVDGGLVSDRQMIKRGGPVAAVGMSTIKQRRLMLPVRSQPGTMVGEYVPFYFCPRSVMLYLLHMGNHPELSYRGGQGPIIHLEADFHDSLSWAQAVRRRWAISLSNAGARYTEFRSEANALAELNWEAIVATDFRAEDIREGKQAEFLMHEVFPWHLITRIGVHSPKIKAQVEASLENAAHSPPVTIQPAWYY